MSKNPCVGCEKRGCGNHANCKEYMDFYHDNRKRGEEHLKQVAVSEYVKDTGDMLMRRKGVLH